MKKLLLILTLVLAGFMFSCEKPDNLKPTNKDSVLVLPVLCNDVLP